MKLTVKEKTKIHDRLRSRAETSICEFSFGVAKKIPVEENTGHMFKENVEKKGGERERERLG